jgi:hypothetical protein
MNWSLRPNVTLIPFGRDLPDLDEGGKCVDALMLLYGYHFVYAMG